MNFQVLDPFSRSFFKNLLLFIYFKINLVLLSLNFTFIYF